MFACLWKMGALEKESESLLHQEQFLMRYLEQHPELILTKIYRDNGETGTKFDRPGFFYDDG